MSSNFNNNKISDNLTTATILIPSICDRLQLDDDEKNIPKNSNITTATDSSRNVNNDNNHHHLFSTSIDDSDQAELGNIDHISSSDNWYIGANNVSMIYHKFTSYRFAHLLSWDRPRLPRLDSLRFPSLSCTRFRTWLRTAPLLWLVTFLLLSLLCLNGGVILIVREIIFLRSRPLPSVYGLHPLALSPMNATNSSGWGVSLSISSGGNRIAMGSWMDICLSDPGGEGNNTVITGRGHSTVMLSDDGQLLLISPPLSPFPTEGPIQLFFMGGEGDWRPYNTTAGLRWGSRAVISADGRRVVTATGGGRIRTWDLSQMSSHGGLPMGQGFSGGDSMVTLALAGDAGRLAVGTPWGKSEAGDMVKVFNYIEDEWVEEVRWRQVTDGGGFGYTLSLSHDGSVVAVGTFRDNIVNIYSFDNISRVWNDWGSTISGEENDRGSFGSSLELSGSGRRLIVGAYQYDNFRGRAALYELTEQEDNTTMWRAVVSDIEGKKSSDRMGRAVTISSDGEYIAVGASDADVQYSDGSGAVSVFRIV